MARYVSAVPSSQSSGELTLVQFWVRFVLGPIARALYRPAVRGIENVPRQGAVILALNHRAALDTAVVALITPRAVRFLGKSEYFTGRGLKGWLMAHFLGGLGYVPVDRGNARAGLAALEAGRRVLAAQGVFAIYPEGTRSRDGRLHRGHTGVATLALSTGATVVPVALTGTENLQPGRRRIPRLAKLEATFGIPLDFSRYEGMESSPAIRRAVTDEIMYALMNLTGLEYSDSYHKPPSQRTA
jgi:1-acyl-sn-glycerol-3-phosphate acyltransferase